MSQTLEKNSGLSARSLKFTLFYAALVLVGLVWFAPVITLVLTALKDAGDFAMHGAFSLPTSIRWENFSEAWQTGVQNYFWNSLIVSWCAFTPIESA